ncbi:spore coat protein [Clostridium cylindrosporum]|uniref:Coat F domain-containing protein n=1 Tax=Clostridium cylindrosporum DSM 605 TaxID=1121307 RepID=A0A0J8D803_CLOCY|nr:spore coat protein [Clostridium cylindrosporum]KMT22180.1 coat F domain-containing protein [Clostridium cylindrosporum DSM 605]
MQINLSQKERMLLEDQKSHEELCIEKYTKYANQTQCSQLKQIFTSNAQSERTHLDSINQLLNGTVPQMNQQQSQQGSSQSMGSQSSQSSSQSMGSQASSSMSSSQSGGVNLSDKDMCTDLLMTEKYVSGTYNTSIFEFRDTSVRDVLNHIQKEEQKHGEAIFQYMESKGMYNVQ